jgi:lysozyme family protein
MTERFKKAMPHIFDHEGGYNDVKGDKGGATNWGISLRLLKGLKDDVNKDGVINWVDIKALTKDHAEDIYWNNFWRNSYDVLPERLGTKIFDTAVNAGNSRAHIILQDSLKSLGSKLVSDGMIGRTTLLAVTMYKEAELLKAYAKEQEKFYVGITVKDATQIKFLKGWRNRAAWLP